MTSIDFGDEHALTDFATFVGRARQARPDDAVRLQVTQGLLLTTVAVLEGAGLLGEGSVLGLRVVRVSGSDDLDVTVTFASISDRLARRGSSVLSVPPVTVNRPWAGLTPPRAGWEPVGSLEGSEVEAVARQGISAVAEGSPAAAGGPVVEALRRQVWGAMTDTRRSSPVSRWAPTCWASRCRAHRHPSRRRGGGRGSPRREVTYWRADGRC